jgi:hypothetical protein
MPEECGEQPMRRILALDGGGIRGIFSLQVLARIEALLRARQGRPDLVLADEFDLIAGTSTGAIIAAGLSWGMAVEAIEAFYLEHGAGMFARVPWYRRLYSKYRAEAIAGLFQRTFSEDGVGAIPARLGSDRLRTLLLIVMRNASTGSPWPVSNNPGAMYNQAGRPDCNLDIPLWQLLRASTAAPSFFPPQEIFIGGERHTFVDGGITPFNNPALLAFLMATLPGYRIGWPAGRGAMHLISVGTGSMRARLPDKDAARISILDQLGYIMPAVMGSVAVEQDVLCRVLGDCVHGAAIDSEIGELDTPTLLGVESQLFTYARYDEALDAEGTGGLTREQTRLDNLAAMPVLRELGRAYAAAHVKESHLFPRNTA